MTDTAVLTLTDKMHDAIERGVPVVLLPPDYPIDCLMSLLIDVVLKGSEGRLLLMPTERPFVFEDDAS